MIEGNDIVDFDVWKNLLVDGVVLKRDGKKNCGGILGWGVKIVIKMENVDFFLEILKWSIFSDNGYEVW